MAWSNITNGEDGLSVRNKLNNLAGSIAPKLGTETVLFQLVGADMNTTADQVFTKLFDFTDYVPIRIIVMDASVNLTGAVGGMYTAPAKGGVALVAASQAWGNLNTNAKVMYPAISAAGMAKLDATPYLSLSTPLGSAGTCNFYVMGFVKP